MKIEERIISLIEERGLTKAAFSERAGLKRQNLNSMLKSPSFPTLEKISSALDVPMWQLFASPEEVTGEGELTALIQHKGAFYKASTIEELEKIVSEIKEKS